MGAPPDRSCDTKTIGRSPVDFRAYYLLNSMSEPS
jgi:hypothetical protein